MFSITRMRSDSGTGSGRISTLWTTEKSAVLARMQTASVSAAVRVNDLSFHRRRRPTRRSLNMESCLKVDDGRTVRVPLFDAQRFRRVDTRGPTRGNQIRQRRYVEKHRHRRAPGHGIAGADPVERARDPPRDDYAEETPRRQPDRRHAQPPPHAQ